MNLDDFSYAEDDRLYIRPEVSLNEQNEFIQKLRDTQNQRNAQIAEQTHNLGTEVPSNLGGLNGSESYFNARYQTPQTNYTVSNLKAAAQAQALNTVINSELEKAQKRYKDAYYAAKDRERNEDSDGTTGSDDDDVIATVEGVVDIESKDADETSDEWSNASITGDEATYGGMTLKRNEGESQSDWEKRAQQWIYLQGVKHKSETGDTSGLEGSDTRQQVNVTTKQDIKKEIVAKRLERAYENYRNSIHSGSMSFEDWLKRTYSDVQLESMLKGE